MPRNLIRRNSVCPEGTAKYTGFIRFDPNSFARAISSHARFVSPFPESVFIIGKITTVSDVLGWGEITSIQSRMMSRREGFDTLIQYCTSSLASRVTRNSTVGSSCRRTLMYDATATRVAKKEKKRLRKLFVTLAISARRGGSCSTAGGTSGHSRSHFLPRHFQYGCYSHVCIARRPLNASTGEDPVSKELTGPMISVRTSSRELMENRWRAKNQLVLRQSCTPSAYHTHKHGVSSEGGGNSTVIL